MNTFTLLRAFSDIAPADMEAALRAGEKNGLSKAEEPLSEESHAAITVKRGKPAEPAANVPEKMLPLRIGGWVAAAACLMLVVGAAMHFRPQDDSGLVLAPSVPEQIMEITGTEPTVTTTNFPETVQTTSIAAETHTETVMTVTVAVADGGTQEAGNPAPASSVTEADAPAETQAPAVTTAVTYAENVPVLIAMADDAGMLTNADGNALAAEEPEWELITDSAAIERYLQSESPIVTLGTGMKTGAEAAKIRENAEMLRIRWQTQEAKWSSYGISYARLDSSGTLRLTVVMYSDGTPQPEADWVYETALLWEGGTLPAVSAVKLEFSYFDDTPEDDSGIPGITEWLAYMAALPDDIAIHVDTPNVSE